MGESEHNSLYFVTWNNKSDRQISKAWQLILQNGFEFAETRPKKNTSFFQSSKEKLVLAVKVVKMGPPPRSIDSRGPLNDAPP